MTAAFQPRTNGPAHRGQSCFFASPSRAPRHRHSRPVKRLAGRKTAPGIFFAAPPKTRPETPSQSLGTHQESTTYVFVFVPGCAVAPNSVAGTPPSTFSLLMHELGLLNPTPGAAAFALVDVATDNWTRNNYNVVPDATTVSANWTELPPSQSVWHQIGPGNENNIKFVSPDGSDEVVYNPNGSSDPNQWTRITNPLNYGTYNYGTNPVTHTLLDILPYWAFGNTPDAPQTIWQRIWAEPPTTTPSQMAGPSGT